MSEAAATVLTSQDDAVPTLSHEFVHPIYSKEDIDDVEYDDVRPSNELPLAKLISTTFAQTMDRDYIESET